MCCHESNINIKKNTRSNVQSNLNLPGNTRIKHSDFSLYLGFRNAFTFASTTDKTILESTVCSPTNKKIMHEWHYSPTSTIDTLQSIKNHSSQNMTTMKRIFILCLMCWHQFSSARSADSVKPTESTVDTRKGKFLGITGYLSGEFCLCIFE